MIKAQSFIDICIANGYYSFSGTPCSYLSSLISYVIDNDKVDFIETTNEGDAVAFACGGWLASQKSIVMFQNSGLGNAINPITSLSLNMKIPFIGIISLRGDPSGQKDEPQHELMGKITTDMLDTMGIPWSYFPTKESDIVNAFTLADKLSIEKSTPYFFIMKKDSVSNYDLKKINFSRKLDENKSQIENLLIGNINTLRRETIGLVKKTFPKGSTFIASTGKTGRELFEIQDDEDNFYMVGSMGCALPIALGLKKEKVSSKVCVLDGDGALLMRLGNLALAGQLKPSGLVHILLDNGVHDSTGGQRTFSEKIDFSVMAKACGYKNIYNVDSLEMLEKAIEKSQFGKDLTFIRMYIKPGSVKNLARPDIRPSDMAIRVKNKLLLD